MITAKEFIKNNSPCSMEGFMIEFAKLHVEKALKEASENFTMKQKDNMIELDMCDEWMEVDKNSILNAYSLENIK
jgi:hypothetical protein